MATLADIIAASRAVRGSTIGGDATPLGNVSTPDDIPEFLRPPSQQWSNKDLTPAARRARSTVDEAPAEAAAASATPYVAPDGGRAEQDRLLAEAKGTLTSAQKFADPIERAGNRAEMDSLAVDPRKASADQFFENLGRGTHAMMNPAAAVRGAYQGVKGGIGGIAEGLASIPEGVQAEWDIAHNLPDTIRGVASDLPGQVKGAGQGVMDWLNDVAVHPEKGGEAVTEALGTVAAPEAAVGALKYTPRVIGKGMTALGKGATAIGESKPVKALGNWVGPTAAFGHPGAAAAEMVVPPALRGIGGALQRGGAKMSAMDIPASLRALGETDLSGPIDRALTPAGGGLTPEAESVAATVRAAKEAVAKGASRGQAAQQAGWPLAGDFELDAAGRPVNKYGPGDFGTHPGQNVEAQRPYKPGSLRGIENATKEGPKTFADTVRAKAEEIRRGGLGGGETAAEGVDFSKFEGLSDADMQELLHGPEPMGLRGRSSGLSDADMNELLNGPEPMGLPSNKPGGGGSSAVEQALADLSRQNPSPYESGMQVEGMSPELMNRVVRDAHVRPGNTQSVNLSKADTGTLAEAMKTVDYQLGYNTPDQLDLSSVVSPEAGLAKLSRKRARAHSARTNTPRHERY